MSADTNQLKRLAENLLDGMWPVEVPPDELISIIAQLELAKADARNALAVLELGSVMANTIFHLAQLEGEIITRDHAAVMTSLRNLWDATRQQQSKQEVRHG